MKGTTMSNLMSRIRRALGLGPKDPPRPAGVDILASRMRDPELWRALVRDAEKRQRGRAAPIIPTVIYDLRKPARYFRLVGPGGVPLEGWRRYWQDRDRDADRALVFAGREFASAVLEALNG